MRKSTIPRQGHDGEDSSVNRRRIVDLYGISGFGALCVTDRLAQSTELSIEPSAVVSLRLADNSEYVRTITDEHEHARVHYDIARAV